MHRFAVGFGKDGHAQDIEFFKGADDANGDFASIGDKHFPEHAVCGPETRLYQIEEKAGEEICLGPVTGI
jgi:hypothetical protein